MRLEYQQDKSLAGASAECKHTKNAVRCCIFNIPLYQCITSTACSNLFLFSMYSRRQDSHGKYRKISNITKSDFTRYLSIKNVDLKPGQNNIVLSCKVS